MEQEKSRKLVPAQTTVRPWCLLRTMVRCETIASSFSFDCVAEIILVFLQKALFRQQQRKGDA